MKPRRHLLEELDEFRGAVEESSQFLIGCSANQTTGSASSHPATPRLPGESAPPSRASCFEMDMQLSFGQPPEELRIVETPVLLHRHSTPPL